MRSCGGKRGHVLAEEADGAGGRQEVAGDAVEERRLAGAVRAEHGAPLAGTHGERDVDERRERAEEARHAAQLERVAVPAALRRSATDWPASAPPPLRTGGAAGARKRWRQRSQRPSTPSGRTVDDEQGSRGRSGAGSARRRARAPMSVEGEGAQDDVDQRADERADRPAEAADDGDDEDVDDRADARRCRARSGRSARPGGCRRPRRSRAPEA